MQREQAIVREIASMISIAQPSHKERAISVVRCEKEGMLLQPLQWCCVDCVIHH